MREMWNFGNTLKECEEKRRGKGRGRVPQGNNLSEMSTLQKAIKTISKLTATAARRGVTHHLPRGKDAP
jgi:hypothetical protein